MTTRQLNRLFHEAAEAAGIKKGVTPHTLRSWLLILLPQVLPRIKTQTDFV